MQLNNWGQLKSDNILIELFPLASPGLGEWGYKNWVDLNSALSFLADRDLYISHVIENRIKFIKGKIKEYQPKVVLFYGKSMSAHWDEIIGRNDSTSVKILDVERYTIRYIKQDKTLFVQCPQPTYIRAYGFWIELGKEIKSLLERSE